LGLSISVLGPLDAFAALLAAFARGKLGALTGHLHLIMKFCFCS
jgi:hypothetical protein